MYEPCLCGADDCPACFPGRATSRYPLGSLDAEDIDILNEEQYRAEQAAADADAERAYQAMIDHEAFMAEQEANSIAAEQWYADNDAPPVETDLF